MANESLLSKPNYFKLFYANLSKSKTHKEAFDKTETAVFNRYGINKFATYESFRNAKSNYLKKIKYATKRT